MYQLQRYQQLFEDYLRRNYFKGKPQELYEPMNYIMRIGGKRLRPALALVSYGLFESKVEPALPVACAVEIFHNFSLVHDDIMDEAPLRRGKPSVHERYDVNRAILSGDVMLVYAYEFLRRGGKSGTVARLVKVFNQVAIEVCEGQQMDMNFEARKDVSIDEYLRMIELKTAALIAGSIEMGAIAARAPLSDVEHLRAFGRNIGIAFQLQDDILDTFGDPEKFGKRIGGDIVQNKKTYLILKALEVADEPVRTELMHYMNTPTQDADAKIQAVTDILRELNIPVLAEAEKERFRSLAAEHLMAVEVSEERKDPLWMVMDKLVKREV